MCIGMELKLITILDIISRADLTSGPLIDVFSVLGGKNNSLAISSWWWVLCLNNCCKLIILVLLRLLRLSYLIVVITIYPPSITLLQFKNSGICVSLPRTISGVSGQDDGEEELA